MKLTHVIFQMLLMFHFCGVAQSKKMSSTSTNTLLCNPEAGICAIPSSKHKHDVNILSTSMQKPIKIVYFTDPICSSCWAIEPQLRKLKLVYGHEFEIEYRMGGLLPDWSYNSGGISKPSDVAHHWDEVSAYYDMPIDGDVWLENPLPSSYPPSIAFKAAQIQDKHKAILFLRLIREMVFLQKKNITQWEYLASAAKQVGLDDHQFKIDFNNKARDLFYEDLRLCRASGVGGFPTLLIYDTLGNREIISGSRNYSLFEQSILKLHPGATKKNYDTTWQGLFLLYQSLTAKEFAELSGTPRKDAEQMLHSLFLAGELKQLNTKNGALWSRITGKN